MDFRPALSLGIPLSADSPLSRHEQAHFFILFRYVLIVAAAYLFLFEGETAAPVVNVALIAGALASNVFLSQVPGNLLLRPFTVGLIVCVDIGWIAAGLWYKSSFGNDIFFLYFFVLFLAATGLNLTALIGSSILLTAVDLAFFVNPGEYKFIWTSSSLIRIPFIFTAAAFYGYLVEQIRREQHYSVELERANKMKTEFLSIMSHELRTPLSVVMGYAGMVKDRLLGEINSEQEKALETVIRRAIDLLTMINSILYATSLEAQAMKAESREVSLSDFLIDLRSTYEVPSSKGLILIWDYPSELLVVKTDSGKLRHILQNLINNAIKFTDSGSVKISARYFRETKTVEFKVADSGIGIPKEKLPTIFEMFRQVDSSETRLYGGVGLGLYIVKRFTELLGGKVEVESELGKGSTFTVTISCET